MRENNDKYDLNSESNTSSIKAILPTMITMSAKPFTDSRFKGDHIDDINTPAKATSSSHNTLSNNSNTKCIADNKNEKYGCDKLVGDYCIFEAWLNDDNLNWFWPLQFYILKCSATVVVAQLAQWSLPTPEDPGSNPAISNFNKEHLLTETVYKMKIKKRQSGKNFRRNKLIIDSFKCDKHRQVFRAA